jgi:hypothetical protein
MVIGECRHYSKWESNEDIKMKQVVLEIPNQNLEVTYNWLKEQKCCEPALDWFVNKFGNKASYDDVLEAAKKERSDSSWLVDSKKYLIKKDENCKYVRANNVNTEKLYILKYKENFYKACYNSGRYFFSDMKKTCNGFDFGNSLQIIIQYQLGAINKKIYEFDNFDDFVNAYRAKKI